MANDADEIVVGASGTAWVGPTSADAPTDSDTTLDTDFVDLGYITEDGVTITDSKEVADIMAWQSFYAVRRIITGRSFSVQFTLEQWNRDSVRFALGGGDLNGMVQVLTMTNWDGVESFKLTWNGTEGATTFVRGTNGTAAAIQAALRTATGDNALTVSGTTNEGPFTITFFDAELAFEVTVTSPSGNNTGATTFSESVYVPPLASDLDERSLVIEWVDGTKDYRLYMPRGIVSESVETNVVRSDGAKLPVTFAATADGSTSAYLLFTNDPSFA